MLEKIQEYNAFDRQQYQVTNVSRTALVKTNIGCHGDPW